MSKHEARMMSGSDLLKTRHAERELTSGKVPLSPIVRTGYLVLGVAFVGFSCAIAGFAISSVVHESWWIKCLIGVVITGWFLLFFSFGRRLLWAALTAPSQQDEDEDAEPASEQSHSN